MINKFSQILQVNAFESRFNRCTFSVNDIDNFFFANLTDMIKTIDMVHELIGLCAENGPRWYIFHLVWSAK